MLWQQFLEQRSNVVGNKMQREVCRRDRDGRVTPQISHPTFPLQVQKIVMDFLKENKDGGKVSFRRNRGVHGPPHRSRPLHSHVRLYRW